ncbi:unnamed protein product [Parascedosporium putredinis]|uniref:Uncharacterized protein n=1 Tax=Parascedosporium putredinis TaxID=1442378 RepID=A0A9P1H2J9_9PEZI|nr:unnamed protein product [Parascedosporium putredinis]CAI7993653.1 unnamed protein product [Parascedosporium putredinis]
MQLLHAGLLSALLALPATAQSPGPSWPACAATSTGFHPGWEVEYLELTERPGEKASPKTGETFRITEDDGECFTTWTRDEKPAPGVTTKVDFILDVLELYFYFEQSWTCAGDEGSKQILFAYANICNPLGPCQVIGQHCSISDATRANPVFVGPAKVESHSTDAEADAPGTTYATPTEQACSAYPNSYLFFELRNLADDSITQCYFESFDYEASQDGLVFGNEWAGLDAKGRGCRTGRNVLVTREEGWVPDGWEELGSPVGQDWHWDATPASISFDTGSYELSLEQMWPCGDVEQAFYGTTVLRLHLDCQGVVDEKTPEECKPLNALYNSAGAPIFSPASSTI